MKTKIITGFILLIIFWGVLFSVFVPRFVFAASIVPCGRCEKYVTTGEGVLTCAVPSRPEATAEEQKPCQPCHIFSLAQKILQLLITLAAPVAIIMLIWSGFLMVSSAANPGLREKGKKVLTNTLIGIAIIFFAWLGIDTIIKALGGYMFARDTSRSGFETESSNFGPWNRIECDFLPPPTIKDKRTSAPPSLPPPSPAETHRAATTKAGAALILRDSRITLAGEESADCKGGNFHAKGVLEAIAADQKPPVCNVSCQCPPGGQSGNVTVSGDLLRILKITADNGKSFKLNSLTTGKHSSNKSKHYQGLAADVEPKSGTTYLELHNQLILNGADDEFTKCEDFSGKNVTCTESGSGIKHMHVQSFK